MSGQMSQNVHFVQGLAPVANAFAGAVGSDVVNCSGYSKVVFVIQKGVGTTGTSTVTVEACDDVVPTNKVAVPFHWKRVSAGDIESAYTRAEAAGFATTAGSADMYVIEVDVEELGDTGFKYCRLLCTELVDADVLGGILIMMHGARHAQDIPPTALV